MAPDTPERGGGRGDAALAHDRARVVRRYLSALDMRRPGRSATRTTEAISHRIHQVDKQLMSADPVQRLHLTQERIDLHAELLRLSAGVETDFAQVEAAFVRVVRSYSDRHGITYSAWRQTGVGADVLERGGVTASKTSRPVKPTAAKPGAMTPDPVASAELSVTPSCLDEVPPVPRAEGPKSSTASAPAEVPAKKRPAAKSTKAAKATRPAKKAPASVQQQLPADASS